MTIAIRTFLIIIAFFHVVTTFLIFWLKIWNTSMLATIREVSRLILLFITLITSIKLNFFITYIKKYFCLILSTLLLLTYWFILSYILWKWIYDIVIWIKYSIRYLFIFLGATFIWDTFFYKKQDITSYINRTIKLIYAIIFSGIIRQLSKFLYPSIFYHLWYWEIWNFVFNQSPPLYYRTWPWWLPRLSWIFSWPNNYWYFLVLFWWLILANPLKLVSNNQLIKKVTYIISIFLTLSRWALLWLCLQLLIITKKYILKYKFLFTRITLSILILLGTVSLIKWWSSLEHFQNKLTWLYFIFDNPIWKGFWTSWPSIHFNWSILPENYYLQLIIDIGVLWFIFWVLLITYFIKLSTSVIKDYRVSNPNNNSSNDIVTTFILLSFWLLWLLFEWLFLHVFEDSMVNYIFFITYWIVFWYIHHNSSKKKPLIS